MFFCFFFSEKKKRLLSEKKPAARYVRRALRNQWTSIRAGCLLTGEGTPL
jgi:hypothetical protein